MDNPMSKKKPFFLPLLFLNLLTCLVWFLVNAAALTGATPFSQKKDINRQLTNLAERQLQPGEEEIKLCYVTVRFFPHIFVIAGLFFMRVINSLRD